MRRGKQGPMDWESLASPRKPLNVFQEDGPSAIPLNAIELIRPDVKPEITLTHSFTDTPVPFDDRLKESSLPETATSMTIRSSSTVNKPDASSGPTAVGQPTISFYAVLPYTLLGYIQLIYHSSIVGIFLYIFFLFGSTLFHDYQLRLAQHLAEAAETQQQCLLQYKLNQCQDNTLPALVSMCQQWLECLEKDPETVYRVPIFLNLLSEWLNLFLEGLSYRTVGLLAISFVLLSIFTNAIFSLAKSKAIFQNKGYY